MKQLSLEETQKEAIRLLTEFSEICEKENLRYYLACGTCLGAVRHEGFIPWDDDIDVYMPRPDYEKLLALNPQGNDCKILDPESPNYAWPFGKFVSTTTSFEEYSCDTPHDYGVFIDIFPLDGLPSPQKKANRYHKYVSLLCMIYFFVYIHRSDFPSTSASKSQIIKIAKIIKVLMSQKRYRSILNRLARKYDFNSSEFVATHKSQAFSHPEVLPRSLFNDTSNVSFEGYTFKTMANPEQYLEIKYGANWNTPKIRTCDHGKAYWKS